MIWRIRGLWNDNNIFRKVALSAGLLVFLIGWHFSCVLAQGGKVGRVIEVDVVGLKSLMEMDPNVMVVDVRSPGEYSGPMKPIPRSINIPAEKLRSNTALLPSNKTIILVCPNGSQSLRLARALAEKGSVVYVLKGGLMAWHKAEKQAPAEEKAVPSEHEQEEPLGEGDMGC